MKIAIKYLILITHIFCALIFIEAEANVLSKEDLSQANIEALTFFNEKGLYLEKPAEIRNDESTDIEHMKYFGYALPEENLILSNNQLNKNQTRINLIHEYTHIYRAKLNSHDTVWLKEGLAQLMEYLASSWPDSYSNLVNQHQSLFISNSIDDYKLKSYAYPSSFFLFYYLYIHFGRDSFLQKVMNSNLTGWENIIQSLCDLKNEGVFSKSEFEITKENIIRHFAVALAINSSSWGKYGLFRMDTQFENLNINKLNIYNNNFLFRDLKDDEIEIVFSKEYIPNEKIKATMSYMITRLDPFEIAKADSFTASLFYIYIRIH